LANFNSVNNFGLEKLHKKSDDNKVQRLRDYRSAMFSRHTSSSQVNIFFWWHTM